MTFSSALWRAASPLSLNFPTNSSETLRRWTGAVSVRRATPASVSSTTTPRASLSALARRTRPSSAIRSIRRVMADRELSVRSASSVIRNAPPASASWPRTSKSPRCKPLLVSRSVPSWRMRLACARSSARQAPKPRRPGSTSATTRSRRPATSGLESTCLCNKQGLDEVFAYASIPPGSPGGNVISEFRPELDPAITRRFGTVADDASVKRATAALEANGITVLRAPNPAEARRIVLDLIPVGAQVNHGASLSLEEAGIIEAVEKSGRYEFLRPRLRSMDRKTQADEIRRLSAAPDVMLGSVHAVTETGSLIAASMGGSQLGPYVSGAGRVILVVGTQKIVPDLEEGLRRVNDYAVLLEDARAQLAYGIHSAVNKVLIINREVVPGRITVVFVDEVLGF